MLEISVLSKNIFASTESFHSVCTSPPPPFEQFHAAVSELEHDDTFDVDKVKLCWCVLIHLTNSVLQISGSFPILERNGI